MGMSLRQIRYLYAIGVFKKDLSQKTLKKSQSVSGTSRQITREIGKVGKSLKTGEISRTYQLQIGDKRYPIQKDRNGSSYPAVNGKTVSLSTLPQGEMSIVRTSTLKAKKQRSVKQTSDKPDGILIEGDSQTKMRAIRELSKELGETLGSSEVSSLRATIGDKEYGIRRGKETNTALFPFDLETKVAYGGANFPDGEFRLIKPSMKSQNPTSTTYDPTAYKLYDKEGQKRQSEALSRVVDELTSSVPQKDLDDAERYYDFKLLEGDPWGRHVFMGVNDTLRGTAEGYGARAKPVIERTIRGLDNSMRETKSDAIVLRGISLDFLPRGELEKGLEIHDKGFISTTLDPYKSGIYGRTGTVLKIKIPKGTRATMGERDPTSYRNQSEVILDRETTIRITSSGPVKGAEGEYWEAEIVKQLRKKK